MQLPYTEPAVLLYSMPVLMFSLSIRVKKELSDVTGKEE